MGEGPPPPPPPSFGHHHHRVPLTATGPAGVIDVRGGPAPVADAIRSMIGPAVPTPLHTRTPARTHTRTPAPPGGAASHPRSRAVRPRHPHRALRKQDGSGRPGPRQRLLLQHHCTCLHHPGRRARWHSEVRHCVSDLADLVLITQACSMQACSCKHTIRDPRGHGSTSALPLNAKGCLDGSYRAI